MRGKLLMHMLKVPVSELDLLKKSVSMSLFYTEELFYSMCK